MRRPAKTIWIITIVLIWAAQFPSPARTAPNVTSVCTVLASDTTWTKANSPYEVCNTLTGGFGIPAGITLTVEPGVTVEFDGSAFPFTVNGTLNALGSASDPILFTAAGASPTKGAWRGITVTGSIAAKAVLNLDFATIQFGGAFQSVEILADQANLTINHSLVQQSASNGLSLSQTTTFSIQNTRFMNNMQDALALSEPKVDLALANLSASGNGGVNGVHITGINTTMTGQRRWSNPGIPYVVNGNIQNAAGDVLTIDPGTELDFSGNNGFDIAGALVAQGSAAAPILMTGVTRAPGAWNGIVIYGTVAPRATASLDYVTVDYGGGAIGGAAIAVSNGYLTAHHITVRNSSKDGIQFNVLASGSVLDSQIYSNNLNGIYTFDPSRAVLASNDWWGDPSGPTSPNKTCGAGTGDKVTAGVLFLPFATVQGQSQPLPLSSYPSITLTPRRWYAPADGLSKIYFDITLRDGNGAPLPGRAVMLSSTLGTVVDGGVTGADGKTLAYVTAPNLPGSATVQAGLQAQTACEGALSPESTVTLTTPPNITDLLPNALASYFNGNITVSPLPVIVGVEETISSRLTNPTATPVTVDVEFGYAQSGIGLVFGPIKDIVGLVLPANSTVPISATVIPPVSGHYCVQISYTITKVGALPQAVQQTAQLQQFNWNAQPSPTNSNDKQAALQKTRTSLKAVNRFVGRAYDNTIVVPLAVANAGIEWDLNNAEKINNALNGDPPRQDYTVISVPVVLQLPPTPPTAGLSEVRRAALNDLDVALAQANAYGTAAALAYDRSGGAAAAGDLTWESTQDGVMLQYNAQLGQALITAAQKIDALLGVAAAEGVTTLSVSTSDIAAFQAQLQTSFTPQQIADAHAVGLTDADLADLRLSILSSQPQDLAGDVIADMHDLSAQFNLLGNVLIHPPVFNPGYTVTGAGPTPNLASGNTMALVSGASDTFPVRNSTAAAGLVTITARRIDLPADWNVQVSPAQATLQAGESATVTVTILAGSPVPQGIQPRVAVEASINGLLLGGVVEDVLVPYYAPFDGKLRLYLPLTRP